MFTQCPNCKTNFQVTAEQLKAANGDVRCGQCLTVFSALDHLSEIELHSKTHETEFDYSSDELTSDTQDATSGDANTSIDKNLEEFFGDLFEDSPDETFDEPIAYANPESSTKKSTKSDGGFFYGANEATIEKILETDGVTQPEPTIEKENEINSEAAIKAEADSDIETDNEAELAEQLTKVSHEIEEAEKVEAAEFQSELVVEAEKAEFQSELDVEAEKADTTVISEDSNPENKTELTELANVPQVILDELQAAKAQQLKPPNTPWVVGSVVLMLVFVLQAVFFSRDSLARNPTYRPLLTSACNVLGCEINIEYDSRLIEIIGRDVRSHPTSKKALIAGTTLINNASYAQPYPLLTLTFSDIIGTKLAQRRFTPREYLRSGTDIAAGMPSETPVQVELHLVDPGKAAVNFEFRAEVDPRS
jgi:predicted Zn finger-like uncharacterized protein